MNPALAIVLVAGAAAAAVGLMLLVRRRAPVGGYFADSDRAAGVFGVVGTGFAVLLAFVIFLAFQSYDRARDKASLEAVSISQLFRTAKLFEPEARRTLHGQLICYARAVVRDEWPAMREGRESPLVEAWLSRIERTIEGLSVSGEKQTVAYGHWFDEVANRREGRRGRLAEAAPFVPSLVWLALFLGGALIVGYMCFYADRGERWAAQAIMMGSVTAMVVAGLLLIRFLDRPYADASGAVKPVAMAGALARMEAEGATAPCDAAGQR